MDQALAPPVRVVVVDDHEVVRWGLVVLLGRDGRFRVVGQACTVEGALAEVAAHQPDLVIMDLRLPDGSGIDACRTISTEHPATRVLILTSYPDRGGVPAAAAAGAAGYVLKRARARDLLAAVDAVVAGASLQDPVVRSRIEAQVRRLIERDPTDEMGSLTPQEVRILELLSDGMSNRGIATSMHLSHKTVKNYVSTVLGKLHLQRRTQAAAYVAHHATEPY